MVIPATPAVASQLNTRLTHQKKKIVEERVKNTSAPPDT